MLTRKLIFNGFNYSAWFFLVAAAVLVAMVLVVVLLRYERRLVPKKVGGTLLVLRLAVLAALFLTLMEPVLRWTLDQSDTGRIVVAMDLSESMTTADTHAGKAEKLRWARALGMIGNDQTNDQIDRWIDAYQHGREPQWISEDEVKDPDRRAKTAQSRRETVEGIFKEIDRLPRKEIALRLLTQGPDPLLPKLKKLGRVELRLFAGKSESADESSLDKLVAEPPASVQSDASDLSQALAAASASGDASPLLGVVLFTDGRDNAGRDSVGSASRLGRMSTPVYPVVMGTVLRPTDLAIADLDYPQTAFKDDHPMLKAKLHTSGFEGRELKVVLEKKGGEPVTRAVTPDGPEAWVEFDLDAQEIGRQEYALRTDVLDGEVRDDNNSKAFAMNVVDDKVRVLLLEGEARWEFRFLDNALTRDERVDISRVVYRQPYMGVLDETFFPRSLRLPDRPDNLEDSPFAEPDLVIIGDVAPDELPEKAWLLLEKFVGEGGGTLVFIAGRQHFPLAYANPIVDALLPVTDLRPLTVTGPEAEAPPTERGFDLRLTPEGEREPMFQFDTDPARNLEIWSGLPGHLWGLLGEAKPGATVYAHAVRPDQKQTLEEHRRAAVVVQQHYGFGQVLWLGIDSTWRWRHRVGDQYHHRFWGQVGRWAAANKATAGNEFVKFSVERTDIQADEDAVLRARWTREFLERFPDLKAKVQIFKVEKEGQEPDFRVQQPFTTLDLKPLTYRPLAFEARAVSLPVGEYRCRLIVEDANLGPEEIVTPLYVKERLSLELQDLSCNRPLLAQLADVSRGKLLLPDEARRLPELIVRPEVTRKIGEEVLLWDHWVVMLMFFGLLMVEWVVRKLNGLP